MNESDLWLRLGELAWGAVRALAMLVATFVPICYFERRQGASVSRYFNRHCFHDVVYEVFYRSGLFMLLGAAYLASGVEKHITLVHWGLLLKLPPIAGGFLLWILMDFVFYWVHRAQHSIPWLWQFHSVHHTTERMTFLTAFRIHPFEVLWHNTLGVIPLMMLGAPPSTWVPFVMFQSFFDAIQHAELNWTWGRFYPVFVSPVFHRIHHSIDRQDYDQNFAKVLSAWDYLFGTACPHRTPPLVVGVEGMPSDPTLAGQFLGPFKRIARQWRPRRAPARPGQLPPSQTEGAYAAQD